MQTGHVVGKKNIIIKQLIPKVDKVSKKIKHILNKWSTLPYLLKIQTSCKGKMVVSSWGNQKKQQI